MRSGPGARAPTDSFEVARLRAALQPKNARPAGPVPDRVRISLGRPARPAEQLPEKSPLASLAPMSSSQKDRIPSVETLKAAASAAWLKDFKNFILRGNVFDLAVGVIIGAAFGKIVASLIADVIMPPLGLIIGGVDFKHLKLSIGGDALAPVTLNYGMFVQTVFEFLIVAAALFLFIKLVERLKRRSEAAEAAAPPPPPSREEQLLSEIRDLLRDGRAGK